MADETYRQRVAGIKAEIDQARPESGVYLFASLDLVGSTQFKAHHSEWPAVITKFYELAVKTVQASSGAMMTWKYIGDEVLFYRRVFSSVEVGHSVLETYRGLSALIESLHNTFDSARKLSVKGTIWMANVTYLPPMDMSELRKFESTENIMADTFGNFESTGIDFLGPDVDIGFRVSKFADKKKLALSANTAYFLLKEVKPEVLDTSNVKILGFESLKGVWNGRPYPVIWYYEGWNRIDESLYYDDKSPIAECAREKKFSSLDTLAKVYSDLGLEKAHEQVVATINATSRKEVSFEPVTIEQNKLAEVHCVAVCFDGEGKVLVAKRPSHKRVLPGIWELGCAQLRLGQTFESCMIADYKADFGADIQIVKNVPFETYVIGGSRPIPGLIFVALVCNPAVVGRDFSKVKHTDIKWLTIAEVNGADDNDFVPNFKSVVRQAHEAYQAWVTARKATN